MKKLIVTAPVLFLAACQSLPPEDRSEWSATPANEVSCKTYAKFGESRGMSYTISGLNLALAAVPQPLAPLNLVIGVVGLATTESAVKGYEQCEEFHEYKSLQESKNQAPS
ncbi:MAG: hypothetical protein HRU20_27910 [Pseudomonadales bacterium]|nr:hypothetical protein [Pseudomonadales bacterium]